MLQGLEKLMEDLKNFNAEEELTAIIAEHTNTIAELNRDQMMEGRGVDGEFIRPFYSENPYFKTPAAAARYARWKQKITPNPQRPLDVPNLYINGYLHDSLIARVTGRVIEMDSNVSFADKAFSVHKNALGLNEEKRLLFAETITIPEFSKSLKEKTGLEL